MAVNTILKSIKQAIWIGWKVETNWTDPLIFSIYYIIRPLAGLLIVGFVFLIGSAVAGTFRPEYFAFMFIGNTFFIYVLQVTMTMSFLIHEDRSRYEVLKHIYLSPGSLRYYILGRALNGVMNASISLVLTIIFGVLIFQGLLGVSIPINWLNINYPAVVLSIIIGTICVIFIGFIFSGINLVSSKIQFALPDYVSGIFYLLGGVVFPPEVLPAWAQTISNVLPITYFLRAVRSSFLLQTAGSFQTDLLYLTLTTIITAVVGTVVFKAAEFKARKDGLIDRKEEY